MLETLDYGNEKFLKCSIGDNVVYVAADKAQSGEITLLPDLESVGIIETERDIKII
ncbi:MAG: hypothetical protein K2N30_01750 [Clostridia bacterium]|nr:hypothetical protein [Clostridia bacterium]